MQCINSRSNNNSSSVSHTDSNAAVLCLQTECSAHTTAPMENMLAWKCGVCYCTSQTKCMRGHYIHTASAYYAMCSRHYLLKVQCLSLTAGHCSRCGTFCMITGNSGVSNLLYINVHAVVVLYT
jgi:hypothetical protein